MKQIPIGASRKSKRAAAVLPNPTPQSLLIALQAQYATRFHMFLIIAASVSIAVLTTRVMLSAGVHAMWVRYTVALLLAYGTFFVGVWVWLHLSQYGQHMRANWGRRIEWSKDAGLDIIPNFIPGGGGASATPAELPFQGGGGSVDGGGAGGTWDVAGDSIALEMPGSGALDDVGSVADVGDEGGALLIVAGILIAIALLAVFGATAYVIYQAPAILAEVIFEVLLGSPLSRGARALDSANWAAVLLRKTWRPFALMAGAAIAFAVFCAAAFPHVTTAGQAIEMMLK